MNVHLVSKHDAIKMSRETSVDDVRRIGLDVVLLRNVLFGEVDRVQPIL
tara:strand:+ start:429 stop:575 length:147 start_codon:yes stop_codon:yes gene_type:complete